MILGHLRSIDLHVQQIRVVKSLSRVDPEGTRRRWAKLIKRRKYSVPGPNSLWHIDGHHSLVRWGFVIHGAIDGFSRLIVFLKCSTNNRKETVADLFDDATASYGVPSRIRTDKGGENVLLWDKMEDIRGRDRGSFIAKSSVHNQRIERLWRDVWNSVCYEFYYAFQSMEDQGLLNNDCMEQMYILHLIYLPRINHVIDSFIKSWNRHPIRTEKNWSPVKLWSNGVIDLRNRQLTHIAEIHEQVDITEDDLEWYGMDWDAPTPSDDGLSTVEVDDIPLCFSEEELLQLHSIDPLELSSSFGIDIYMRALDVVNFNS